jgi:hypothetical protein
MGPGESSHAYAIAKHFKEKGHQVVFALQQSANVPFYSHSSLFDLVVTPTVTALQELVSRVRPRTILLCNSKAFNATAFAEIRPWETIPTFGVDSNWLFESAGPYRCIQWLDRYFVVFPSSIFKLGLKENGGHFTIPAKILPRVVPVGFIPSYQKLDERVRWQIRQNLHIQSHEKLVFCYISGRGSGVMSFVLHNVCAAVEKLRSKGRAIKVLVVGNPDLVEKLPSYIPDWLLLQRSVLEDFYPYLASTDLVFQHHGFATLVQALSAQIPVIANVAIQDAAYPRLQVNEVTPLYRAGLCKLLYKSSPSDEIQDVVESLLYNEQEIGKMQEAQKKHYSKGEEAIYEAVKKYLNVPVLYDPTNR